jgi:hypothetical protein
MSAQQLTHSVQSPVQAPPYITVERDARGGACWVVVGLGTEVRCYCGHRAIAMMEMMCASKGIPTP